MIRLMPILHAISVEGYRCFPQRERLELRPITLLYGRNNAGKSTLLRLLPILSASVMEQAMSPWDLGCAAGRSATFLDALSQQSGSRRMKVALEWQHEEGLVQDCFTLHYEDHLRRVYVDRIEIIDTSGPVFDAQSRPHPDVGLYDIVGEDIPTELCFVGLIPDEDTTIPALRALRDRLRTLRRRVDWLGPNRPSPGHIIRAGGGVVRSVGHTGELAPQALVADPLLLERVANWYSRDAIGRSLRLEPVGREEYHVLMDVLDSAARGISLADAGDGMAQVLPVLVATALAESAGEGAIQAIEDPGAHLHGDARRELAEHFCQTAKRPGAPRLVLETHSRTFVLGVQLAIADGTLPREAVLAYWVEQESDGHSVAHRVEFDRHGAPRSAVLKDVLAEDRAITRELLRHQIDSLP